MSKSKAIVTNKLLKGLTVKQALFVEALLADQEFNTKKAAITAGFKNPTQDVARMMKNEKIVSCICKMIEARNERLGLDPDGILKMLHNIIYLDPIELGTPGEDADCWEISGNLEDIPKHIRLCIQSYRNKTKTYYQGEEECQETVVEIKLLPKMKAIGLAMKHFGMLDERMIHMHGTAPNVTEMFSEILQNIEQRRSKPPNLEHSPSKSRVIDADYVKRIAQANKTSSEDNGNGKGKKK